MNFYVLTLFPELIRQIAATSMLGRASENGLIRVETVNIRDYAVRSSMRVDDYPYGGGAGIVMEAEPVFRAVSALQERIGKKPRLVYLTPQAKVLDQRKVEELSAESDLILLCGHYEGIDDRVLDEVVTDYISIGDYVLTGGELAAGVLIDAVSRFVPGVLGNEESAQFESLQDQLLEHPHYTRPEVWHGKRVPEVLLSGDHARIEEWRYEQALLRTRQRRPELFEKRLRVTGIWYGPEPAGTAAADVLRRVSMHAELLDYNRRKLQKGRRHLGEKELLVLFVPEPEKDAPETGADAPAELPVGQRLQNLRGENTFLVPVFMCSAGAKEAAADVPAETGEGPSGILRDELSAWAVRNGFRTAGTFCLEQGPDAEKKTEELVRELNRLRDRIAFDRPEA